MRFWDASALFALVAVEPSARALRRAIEEDPWGISWFFTPVEIRSALARRRRAGEIEAATCEAAWKRLEILRARFSEVDSFPQVRERAERLLDGHALRAADALQLPAAIVSAGGDRRISPSSRSTSGSPRRRGGRVFRCCLRRPGRASSRRAVRGSRGEGVGRCATAPSGRGLGPPPEAVARLPRALPRRLGRPVRPAPRLAPCVGGSGRPGGVGLRPGEGRRGLGGASRRQASRRLADREGAVSLVSAGRSPSDV